MVVSTFPPYSSVYLYESPIDFVECILNRYPNHSFIIYGDYNIPEVSWENDDSGLTHSFTVIPEAFVANGFFQINSTRNTHNSILDLFFTSSDDLIVEKSYESVVLTDPYHPPLNISFRSSLPTSSFNCNNSFFKFHKANYINIRSFDWYIILTSLDPDSAVNVLYDALHKSIFDFVPQYRFKESTFPSWFTKDLKKLLLLKKKAHEKFKFESKKCY